MMQAWIVLILWYFLVSPLIPNYNEDFILMDCRIDLAQLLLRSCLYNMCFPCCMLFSFYAGISAMWIYLLGLGREDDNENSDQDEDDETIVHGDEHLYQIAQEMTTVSSAETRRLVQERMQPWIPDAIRYQPPPRPASVAIMLSTSPEPMHCDYLEPELPRPVPITPSEAVYTIEPIENEGSTNEGDRYPVEIVTHRDSIKEEKRRSFKQTKKDSVLTLREAGEQTDDKTWVCRTAARLAQCIRHRITDKNGTKTPDFFLDKFETKAFDDPEEPLYQPTTCSLFCGVKLAFDPTAHMHYHWLAVVSLAILYNMVFVIGRAVFWEMDKLTWIWYLLDYICDAIYVIDTVIHMHEGYLEQGLMVKEAKMLRLHYLKSDAWRYDLISLFPTDLAYYWWIPGSCSADCLPCPVIVRLNRLFRLPRMWEWFDRTETATSFPNVFRICKVVMGILVLIHWNACLYFAISYAIGFGTDNWVYNITGPRNETLAHQYIYSFYWSTLTLTTIGETPQPEIDAEYLFVVADFLAGVLIFATIVGNIGSMISNMNVARVEFQNKMDGVKQYMAFRKVSGELEARVIRWFAYTWAESGALDEENVLSSLPDKLKAEIAIRVHLDTLRKVRIFQDCEPGLLEALVLKLRLQVFSPGDYICRKGDVGKEMYIVKRGRLQVVADDGHTVLATLSAGSVFGEVSVLEIAGNRTGNRRTANVRALGYSDLFCLAKKDLWEALADYPDARTTLTERGCQLLRKDGLLDETLYQNAQNTRMGSDDMVKYLLGSYEMVDVRMHNLATEMGTEHQCLKQRLDNLDSAIKYISEKLGRINKSPVIGPGHQINQEKNKPARAHDVTISSEDKTASLIRGRGSSLTPENVRNLLPITVEPRSQSMRVRGERERY